MHEMQELQVQSLGWEDPLEKEMATHSSILAFNFYGQRTLAGYSQWGCKRVRCDWAQEQTEFQEAVVSPVMVVCWVQSKVQFSCSVVSNSATPETEHARRLWPSLSPGVCSNSYSSSQRCHPTTSSCHPLSSCPQSFPASGSFPMSQLFASDGRSIKVSTSATVLPMDIQGWFPLGLTGLISLHPRDSQESSPAL